MTAKVIRTDFGNLFDGSARLGLLLGETGMPWTATTPFLKAFPEELNAYLELSVETRTGEVGLMTRGTGKDFCHRFGRVLESNGISTAELRRFLVRAKYFDHLNVFVKMEIGHQGISEFSYYFRRRPERAVAHAWLQDSGVAQPDRAILDSLSDALAVRTVQFLATSLSADSNARLDKVYLCPPTQDQSWAHTLDALRLAGVDQTHIDRMDQHSSWKERTIFVTVGWENGTRREGAKLYVHGAKQHEVEAIMTAEGNTKSEIERANLLCSLHERKSHDYVGFDLRPGQRIGTKVYGYHHEA